MEAFRGRLALCSRGLRISPGSREIFSVIAQEDRLAGRGPLRFETAISRLKRRSPSVTTTWCKSQTHFHCSGRIGKRKSKETKIRGNCSDVGRVPSWLSSLRANDGLLAIMGSIGLMLCTVSSIFCDHDVCDNAGQSLVWFTACSYASHWSTLFLAADLLMSPTDLPKPAINLSRQAKETLSSYLICGIFHFKNGAASSTLLSP
ncbi:predicted protein [Coccidioides posadasii str. Silveira]|uniref:Predicted protein n=1 Tax=Coccidioides posadasii (strain RMSCC 757 / Silveira) TaxID=443226 RepID=E9DAI7_COCPS|nr:predicted protein [Coccidioides posadasii str. Silveira]